MSIKIKLDIFANINNIKDMLLNKAEYSGKINFYICIKWCRGRSDYEVINFSLLIEQYVGENAQA